MPCTCKLYIESTFKKQELDFHLPQNGSFFLTLAMVFVKQLCILFGDLFLNGLG